MTRILSLWFPTFATDRLDRRQSEKTETPLVTVAKVKGAQRIAAIDARAAATVRPGMSLADARAVCPTLRVADADPAGEAETLGRILDWCRRFTPLAALDAPDGLLLDVTGVAHLFDGETGLIAAAETALTGQGWTVQAAIADTAEAAWALARFGDTRTVAPGSAAILALADPLPLAALRLPPDSLDALAQAGLRRIGDVTIRPRAPLAARFGQGLFSRLDGLLGLIKTPIRPSLPVPVFLAERRYLVGITRIEAVEHALGILAQHLSEQLSRAGQGARQLEALFFRVDGVVKRLAVGTSRPLRDPAALARLFREKLTTLGEDGLDTGYGFDLIRLAAETVERLDTAQGELATMGSAEALPDAEFAHLVDRLGARLGATRVLRLTDANEHRPEDAAMHQPAHRAKATEVDGDFSDLDRPLRLFDRPEPIEATAAVPDGPPAQFRWRRALHNISAIEGPERIAPRWWAEAGPVRDYFQAEDGDGHRYWLFREGTYHAGQAHPRWFLHGLFG